MTLQVSTTDAKTTTLQGQQGYSPDLEAFMLHDDLMVICTNDDGPNYMTKEQAKLMFNLVEVS